MTQSGDRNRFDAFLSYCQKDRAFARTLQRRLETFARPAFRLRSMRVFRDETNLTAHPDLWGRIRDALHASKHLVVLASPSAVDSEWVEREVLEFLETDPDAARILFVRLAPSDHRLRGLLPPRVVDAVTQRIADPLYVDFARLLERPAWRHRSEWNDKVSMLAATILGRSKDALFAAHVRARRRRVFAIAAVAITLPLGSYLSWRQIRASAARERQQMATRFKILAEVSLENGDGPRALVEMANAHRIDEAVATFDDLWNTRVSAALEAWQLPVPFEGIGPAPSFVRDSLTVFSLIDGAVVGFDLATGAETVRLGVSRRSIVRFSVSPNGDWVSGVVGDGSLLRWNRTDFNDAPESGSSIDAEDVVVLNDGKMVIKKSSSIALHVDPDAEATWSFDTESFLAQLLRPSTADAFVWFDGNGRVTKVRASDGETIAAVTVERPSGFAVGPAFVVDPDLAHVAFMENAWMGRPPIVHHFDGREPTAVRVDWATAVCFGVEPGTLLVATPSGRLASYSIVDGEPIEAPVDDRDVPRSWQIESLHSIDEGHVLAAIGADPSRSAVCSIRVLRVVDSADAYRFTGLLEPAYSIDLSPDGAEVAVAGENEPLRVLRSLDGEETQRLGPPMTGTAVAYGPASKILAVGGHDGILRLWRRPRHGAPWPAHPSQELALSELPIRSLQFDDCGTVLVAGTGRLDLDVSMSPDQHSQWHHGSVHVVSVSSEELTSRSLGKRGGAVTGAAIRGDGRFVLATCSDNTVAIWDLEASKSPREIPGPKVADAAVNLGRRATATACAFAPDGRTFSVGYGDGSICRYETQTAVQLTSFQGHALPVTSLAYGARGTLLISGAAPGQPSAVAPSADEIRLWAVDTESLLSSRRGVGAGVVDLDVSRDGRRVVVLGSDRRLSMVEIASGVLPETFECPDMSGGVEAAHPNGPRAFVSKLGGGFELLDWRNGLTRTDLPMVGNPTMFGCGFSAAGDTLFVPEADNILVLSSDGELLRTIPVRAPQMPGVSITEDESTVGVFDSTRIELFDLSSPDGPPLVAADPPGGGSWIGFDPEHRIALLRTPEAGGRFVHIGDGSVVSEFSMDDADPVSGIPFDGGAKFLVGFNTHELFVISVDGSEPASPWNVDVDVEGDVLLGFSPDGNRVVIQAEEGPISLFDVRTGARTELPVPPSFEPSRVAFSNDDRIIAFGGGPTIARWELAEGLSEAEMLHKLTPEQRYLWASMLTGLEFDEEGSMAQRLLSRRLSPVVSDASEPRPSWLSGSRRSGSGVTTEPSTRRVPEAVRATLAISFERRMQAFSRELKTWLAGFAGFVDTQGSIDLVAWCGSGASPDEDRSKPHSPKPSIDDGVLSGLEKEMREAFLRGRLETAAEIAERILDERDSHARAWMVLAEAALDRGESSEAATAAETAVRHAQAMYYGDATHDIMSRAERGEYQDALDVQIRVLLSSHRLHDARTALLERARSGFVPSGLAARVAQALENSSCYYAAARWLEFALETAPQSQYDNYRAAIERNDQRAAVRAGGCDLPATYVIDASGAVPGASSQIEQGDVIVEIDGHRSFEPRDAQRSFSSALVAARQDRERVTRFVLLRGGSTEEVAITGSLDGIDLGVVFDIGEDRAVIGSVTGSQSNAGIQPKDILERVNGAPVRSRADYDCAVAAASGSSAVRVEILRADRSPAGGLQPDQTLAGRPATVGSAAARWKFNEFAVNCPVDLLPLDVLDQVLSPLRIRSIERRRLPMVIELQRIPGSVVVGGGGRAVNTAVALRRADGVAFYRPQVDGPWERIAALSFHGDVSHALAGGTPMRLIAIDEDAGDGVYADADGTILHRLTLETSELTHIAISPGADLLAVARGASVELVRPSDGEQVWYEPFNVAEFTENSVETIAWVSPRELGVVTWDGLSRVTPFGDQFHDQWLPHVRTWRPPALGFGSGISRGWIDPASRYIAVTPDSRSVRVFDSNAHRESSLLLLRRESPEHVSFSESGLRAVVITELGSAYVFDLPTTEPLLLVETDDRYFKYGAIDAAGRFVVLLDDVGVASVYDVDLQTEFASLQPEEGEEWSHAEFASDGDWMLLSDGSSQTRIYRMSVE